MCCFQLRFSSITTPKNFAVKKWKNSFRLLEKSRGTHRALASRIKIIDPFLDCIYNVNLMTHADVCFLSSPATSSIVVEISYESLFKCNDNYSLEWITRRFNKINKINWIIVPGSHSTPIASRRILRHNQALVKCQAHQHPVWLSASLCGASSN